MSQKIIQILKKWLFCDITAFLISKNLKKFSAT